MNVLILSWKKRKNETPTPQNDFSRKEIMRVMSSLLVIILELMSLETFQVIQIQRDSMIAPKDGNIGVL